ncbi:hypothetical protein Ahy_A03g013133 [Arachis hypogaea]|uniref:Uncharacterized protein n=1 Tax=Arachis hypogaea TaxID=3818 RepID=A0A445DUY8_ARAHY|nr:hypothetical protein Ahy_A03g013133 [Arachis hypogaea]
MAARSRQAALDEIQETYRKQYKRIADYYSELLWANPGSIVKLKVQSSPDFKINVQHSSLNNFCIFQRICAKDRSHTHLSRRVQIERCSNYGESGHNRGGCSKPPLPAPPPKYFAIKKTNRGRKRSSLQPTIQSATRGRKSSSSPPKVQDEANQKLNTTTISAQEEGYIQLKPTSYQECLPQSQHCTISFSKKVEADDKTASKSLGKTLKF